MNHTHAFHFSLFIFLFKRISLSSFQEQSFEGMQFLICRYCKKNHQKNIILRYAYKVVPTSNGHKILDLRNFRPSQYYYYCIILMKPLVGFWDFKMYTEANSDRNLEKVGSCLLLFSYKSVRSWANVSDLRTKTTMSSHD